MKIDSRLFTSKIRITFTLFLGVFVINLALLIFLYVNGINFYKTAAIICIVAFIGYLVTLCFGFNFVSYSDEKDKIILRYYYIHPGIKKLYSIEIPKSTIANFKVQKRWFGIRKYLVLFQKTKKGVAEFPMVNVSSLTEVEIQNILKSISRQLVVNKVHENRGIKPKKK